MKENKGRERKKRKWEKIERDGVKGKENKKWVKIREKGKIKGKEIKEKILEIWEERRVKARKEDIKLWILKEKGKRKGE